MNNLTSFIIVNKKKILSLCYVVIFLLAIWIRLIPAYLPQCDIAAKKAVNINLLQDSTKQINENFPLLDLSTKKGLIQNNIENKLKNKTIIDKLYKEKSKELKSKYKNIDGIPFFIDPDSFMLSYINKCIVDKGYIAGLKYGFTYSLMYYLSAYSYKIFSFFFGQVPLLSFLFYFPVFIFIFLFISVFLFCKYFFSIEEGFAALFLVTFCPVLIYKNSAGCYDKDPLILLLTLAIISLISIACIQKNIKKTFHYSFFASIFMGAFSATWRGYPGFFAILLIAHFLLLAGSCDLRSKKINTNILSIQAISFITFLSSSLLWIFIFSGNNIFKYSFDFLKTTILPGLKIQSLISSVMPNPSFSIQELNSMNFSQLGACLVFGKYSFIFVSLLLLFSLLFLLTIKNEKKKPILFFLSFFLFVFFIISLRMNRVVFIFAMFFCILGGIFCCRLLNYCICTIKKYNIKIVRISSYTILILFITFLSWGQFNNAKKFSYRLFPPITSSYGELLDFVKHNTPEDSIIATQWDKGYLFTVFSDREPLIHGGSPTSSINYWFSRVLISTNETESLRLLKVLVKSRNLLFTQTVDALKSEAKAIRLFETLAKANLETSDHILKKYFVPIFLRTQLKEAFFKKPAHPIYFALSPSIIKMIPAASFMSNWDYNKYFIYKNRFLSKEKLLIKSISNLGISFSEFEKLYANIIINASYMDYTFFSRKSFIISFGDSDQKNGLLLFKNGVVWNKDNNKTFIFNNGFFIPEKIFIYSDNKLSVFSQKNSSSKYSILFHKRNSAWNNVIFSDAEISQSLLCQLYYLKGKYLKNFKLVYEDTKNNLYLYKVLF